MHDPRCRVWSIGRWVRHRRAALVYALACLSIAPRSAFAAGGLDPTFGDGGIVASVGCSGQVADLVVTETGQIVFAGSVEVDGRGGTGWTFGRLLPDGSLDRSLAGRGCWGVAALSFDGGRPYALVVHADGSFTMGGADASRVTMIRHRSDGSLDDAFGEAGLFTPDASGSYRIAPQRMALDARGRLWMAGGHRTAVVVSRRLADGSPDPEFADDGFAAVDVSDLIFTEPFIEVLGFAIQSDDRMLVLARKSGWDLERELPFVVVRLLPSGELDPSFGDGGRVTEAFDGVSTRLRELVLHDGGDFSVVASLVESDAPRTLYLRGAAVARFRPDGRLRRVFGDAGRLLLGTGSDLRLLPYGVAAAVADDGRLVLVGSAEGGVQVIRLNSGGRLDRALGRRGILERTLPGVGTMAVYDAELQRDGRLLVGGSHEDELADFGRGIAIARLLLEGSTDRRVITPRRRPVLARRR